MSIFNRRNFFGKHCIWACIPGWYHNDWTTNDHFTNGVGQGMLESVGQRMVFLDDNLSSAEDTSSHARDRTDTYGHLGTCKAIRLTQNNPSGGRLRFIRSIADGGIIFPDKKNFTILTIIRPIGDGRGGGTPDPRVFSKDTGSGEQDHDLMIGIVDAGNYARCRVRSTEGGGTTISIFTSTTTIQDDALNLIAGGLYQLTNTSNTWGWCAHLREDGAYDDNSETTNGTYEYAPRTTTGIAIGANYGAADNEYHGDIIGIWAFDISLKGQSDSDTKQRLMEFFKNPWQVFAPKTILVPVPLEEAVLPGVVTGDISFDITTDKAPTNTLTAEATASFLVNLLQQQAVPSVDASISFDMTADQDQTNTATRPVSFTATINLDQLQTNIADRLESLLLSINAQQEQTNVKITNNIATFTTNLDLQTFNELIGQADVTLATELTFDILNQLDKVESTQFSTVLDQQQSNQLDATASLTLSSILDLEVLNTIAANVNISLDAALDMLQSADGAGDINAAITFAVTASQVQTNVMTAAKAADFIMNMAQGQSVQLDKTALLSLLIQASDEYQAQRGVPGDTLFGINLDETQSNLATRVAAISFATAIDQAITTQLDYNLFVNLATALSVDFTTDGEVNAAISFGVDADQQIINTKTVGEAINLALLSTYDTAIHLTATGNVSFASQMDMIQTKQLLGQSEITFGHIVGLASIGSADLGEDITFSTVQDMQVNGFLIEFTLVTPRNRTMKVFIEDRTITIDEGERTIVVGKQS